MLGLILATALATQVYEQDFYFIKAQEDWIIDDAKPPIRYSQFIPKELCEQVDLWNDDCWRCKRRANEAVVRMGPDMIRWLFYPLRAKSPSVALHAEAVINRLIACPECGGDGECDGYVQSEGSPEMCVVCHAGKSWHEYGDKICFHCNGRGKFAIDHRPYNYGGFQF